MSRVARVRRTDAHYNCRLYMSSFSDVSSSGVDNPNFRRQDYFNPYEEIFEEGDRPPTFSTFKGSHV